MYRDRVLDGERRQNGGRHRKFHEYGALSQFDDNQAFQLQEQRELPAQFLGQCRCTGCHRRKLLSEAESEFNVVEQKSSRIRFRRSSRC